MKHLDHDPKERADAWHPPMLAMASVGPTGFAGLPGEAGRRAGFQEASIATHELNADPPLIPHRL